jgi:Fur family ferric uptake transcriptional regulator
MICTSCGKVFEFRNAEIEKLKERIAKSRGFRMQKHSLRIFGTCKDCFVS